MRELTLEAKIENVPTVLELVDEELEAYGCPMKEKLHIDIAVDEMFSNIALYAYRPGEGLATVRMEITEDPSAAVITFFDQGVPYDPLKKPDPDVTLSAEERQIGGLGIYMVKKSMDSMTYEYKDGQNILRIEKRFQKD